MNPQKMTGFRISDGLSGLVLTLVALTAVPSAAQVISSDRSPQSVMVLGDSISAGFEDNLGQGVVLQRPGYRQALLDIFSAAGCEVDMVGDQTRSGYDYRFPDTRPGYDFPGFTRDDGYDVDHQAFPAITAANFNTGVGGVSSAADYVAQFTPDYLLVHLGSNDLAGLVRPGVTPSVGAITANIFSIVDGALAAGSSQMRILVANVIPYSRTGLTVEEVDIAEQISSELSSQIQAAVAARANSRIRLVDVRSGFDTADMTVDNIHPNLRGETHMAQAFARELRVAGLCPDNPLPITFPALPHTTPTLISPTPDSTLESSTQVIQWRRNNAEATQWYLRVGSELGLGDYFEERILDRRAIRRTVSNLPTDGSLIYIQLSNRTRTGWNIRSYSVTAVGSGAPPGGQPFLTSPSTLTGSTAVIQWDANGAQASQWYIRVGDSAGGTSYADARIVNPSARSYVVSGLPTDGRALFIELSNRVNGIWNIQDFQVTAADFDSPPGRQPFLTSPSTLPGPTALIQWDANGVSASQWYLRMGDTEGGTRYVDARIRNADARSYLVSGLPTDGRPIYIELSNFTNGAWNIQNFQVTAAGQ